MRNKFIIVGIIVFLVVFISGYFLVTNIIEQVDKGSIVETTIIVKDKYIKLNPETGLDQYLIVSTDNRTFKIVDTDTRKNSTDLYNRFDIHKNYTILIQGERNPEFSEYPNILKIIE